MAVSEAGPLQTRLIKAMVSVCALRREVVTLSSQEIAGRLCCAVERSRVCSLSAAIRPSASITEGTDASKWDAFQSAILTATMPRNGGFEDDGAV